MTNKSEILTNNETEKNRYESKKKKFKLVLIYICKFLNVMLVGFVKFKISEHKVF